MLYNVELSLNRGLLQFLFFFLLEDIHFPVAFIMESEKADGEIFLFTSESVGEGHPGE